MKKPADLSSVPGTTILTFEDIIETLETGGFLAHIPHVIEPEFTGFPVSVCYRGVHRMPPDNSPRLVVSRYFFAPHTFREDEEQKEMIYVHSWPCPYQVRVVYHKESQRWETLKLKDGEVIRHASGVDLEQAMVETTKVGLEQDEPFVEAVEGIYTATRGLVLQESRWAAAEYPSQESICTAAQKSLLQGGEHSKSTVVKPTKALRPAELPPFDGFPYLMIELVGAFYHINLLPAGCPDQKLIQLAAHQALVNKLRVVLVLSADLSIHFQDSGQCAISEEIPHGYIVVQGILETAEQFPETSELLERQARLESYAELAWPSGDGTLFGDLTKGGRDATPQEAALLAGSQEGGVPRGLSRCPRCLEWKGECLDPSPQFQGKVMVVHCRCENDNWCARCGCPLAERKLKANYYNESDGRIWHVPGFSALKHRCEGGQQWKA